MNPGVMMAIASMMPMIMEQMGGGKDAKTGSNFSPGQQGNFDQLNQWLQQNGPAQNDISQNQNYKQGQDWMGSLFNDQDFFDKFEAPMQRQFNEQTVPDLANRFASQGSGGSLGSTGFRNQLAREGSNLSTNMAAQRGMMQQSAIPHLLQYGQQPFQNMMTMWNAANNQGTQNQYFPAEASPLGKTTAAFSGGFANAAGEAAGKDWMTQGTAATPAATA